MFKMMGARVLLDYLCENTRPMISTNDGVIFAYKPNLECNDAVY